jgi:ribonuclease VapC
VLFPPSTRMRRRAFCACVTIKRWLSTFGLLAENDIEIVPFDEIQVRAAAVALDRYGKGIDPKARLNLCDCAAYALAKTMNSPLLFKGSDFTATDVRAVI